LPTLSQARDAELDPTALAPWIQKYAEQYGVDPQIIGAVVAQESSFINHAVHRDGTGHGLVGLDDNGLLPDFERWSGTNVGRGRRAATIAPEQQIEFLAKTLADFGERLGGDEWGAVRAWHAGFGGRNRANGVEYERLIRGRISQVASVIAPFSAGAAPPDELLAARPAGPVTLKPAEGSTPVRGSVDYENG
jgi:soluble lytic murein transglycosylase-like protein